MVALAVRVTNPKGVISAGHAANDVPLRNAACSSLESCDLSPPARCFQTMRKPTPSERSCAATSPTPATIAFASKYYILQRHAEPAGATLEACRADNSFPCMTLAERRHADCRLALHVLTVLATMARRCVTSDARREHVMTEEIVNKVRPARSGDLSATCSACSLTTLYPLDPLGFRRRRTVSFRSSARDVE